MQTTYTVSEAGQLKNGTVMVSGSVEGPLISVGQEGVAQTEKGIIRVAVIGVGIMDPNIAPRSRQGILVKMLDGEASQLKGATLLFELPSSVTHSN